MRANRQLTGSVTWGVESTIPSSISGIVAVAADMNLTARAELTQAPCCSPFPWVGFSVINRWAAKIERGGTHTQEHTHTCSEGDGSECVCSFSHKYTLKLRQPSNATVHVSVNKQIHLQKLQCDWIPQTHTHTHTNTHTRHLFFTSSFKHEHMLPHLPPLRRNTELLWPTLPLPSPLTLSLSPPSITPSPGLSSPFVTPSRTTHKNQVSNLIMSLLWYLWDGGERSEAGVQHVLKSEKVRLMCLISAW